MLKNLTPEQPKQERDGEKRPNQSATWLIHRPALPVSVLIASERSCRAFTAKRRSLTRRVLFRFFLMSLFFVGVNHDVGQQLAVFLAVFKGWAGKKTKAENYPVDWGRLLIV